MEQIPNFADLRYERPDYDAAAKKLTELTARVREARSFDELRQIIDEKNEYMAALNLNAQLAFIRCYLDSSDAFYAQEMQYNDQHLALLDDAPFAQALLDSPFAAELDAAFGPLYLQGQRDHVRLTANGRELMAREQELIGQYQQLKAKRRISFDGKELSEGEMTAYLTSTDRDTRREAMLAGQRAVLAQKEELDSLLDELVKTRIAIARANGFDRYADYINLSKGRRGYGQPELLAFCRQVKEHLVPLLAQLYDRQARHLGLETLCPWDVNLVFPDGNAKPIGDAAALLDAARGMYDRLSPDISALFRTMADKGYIDAAASPNKIAGMGFCDGLHALKMPYVFGNCDGSINDATVLTHEVGHAYQMRQCMLRQPVPEYCDMPNDVVEIPSKTMEQFTIPFAALFFGKDADKFRFAQQRHVVREICVFCAECEFEDWLYAHPEATAQQRIDKDLEISRSYNPGVDYAALEELQRQGTSLYQDMGVYMFPGYLISYALSDMGALELSERSEADFGRAWADYEALCAAGGSLDYDDLMSTAHLSTAYADGAVARAAEYLRRALGKYDY